MKKVELDKLFMGIHDAVTMANVKMRQQYAEMIGEFFDEQNKPIHVELSLPEMRGSEVTYKKVKVPKLTLVPLSLMKVKEVNLTLKLNQAQLALNEIEDPSSTPSRVKKNRQSKKNDDPEEDQIAHIEIKMEGSEPPEGILKINDYLFDQLP